ncbi:hypothetical protein [Oceanicella sp. SM1341]|uniref:hypothetical protein n=1 Tax=Oceanicella sp. SM1341 TaxID=1548889 RepID=UPI0013002A05|nr:hypothetical protein [Oceanicella sp. SM1341]
MTRVLNFTRAFNQLTAIEQEAAFTSLLRHFELPENEEVPPFMTSRETAKTWAESTPLDELKHVMVACWHCLPSSDRRSFLKRFGGGLRNAS